MRIAIDARTVAEVRSGVGNYVLNLLKGLKEVAPEHELFLLGRAENLAAARRHLPSLAGHCTRVSHESHPLGDLWEHFVLPGVLKRHQVEVLHGPATLIPLPWGDYTSVATIHDLVAFLYPETIPTKYAIYMTWLIKRVVRRAGRIISVSQSTKDDLVRELGVDPGRISVVHEAAHPAFRPVEDQDILADVRRRYGISRPFFYHVGNIEPRKNLVNLLKAFISLRPRLKGQAQLVVSGQQGWLTGRLNREMAGLDLGDDIIFTGYVPHADLPLLMNAALAFVFPSLYEGFGLPALEALACGTPLITSNLSSLPEIVGPAALLVEPKQVEDIAQAMWRLWEDEALRGQLSGLGLRQAAGFSWQRAARETLAVYQLARGERLSP